MNEQKELPKEIKWRESRYMLTGINDNGEVEWFNPVSRHRAVCSQESWRAADPYNGKYN